MRNEQTGLITYREVETFRLELQHAIVSKQKNDIIDNLNTHTEKRIRSRLLHQWDKNETNQGILAHLQKVSFHVSKSTSVSFVIQNPTSNKYFNRVVVLGLETKDYVDVLSGPNDEEVHQAIKILQTTKAATDRQLLNYFNILYYLTHQMRHHNQQADSLNLLLEAKKDNEKLIQFLTNHFAVNITSDMWNVLNK